MESKMLHALAAPASAWVKQTMAGLTMDEKLGQLYTSRAHVPDIDASIAAGIVGNLYTRTDIPAERLAELKSLAKVPMIISADLESGSLLGQNIWPAQMALGATDSTKDAYQWAYCHGLQARRYGVNSAFGPVFDVSLNPAGLATGTRTFGADPAKAARLAVAAIKGYQDAGILPYAKHFPGFGRGWEDAHFELSNLDADRDTLLKEDLLPYIRAVEQAGLPGVMTGHIRVPAVDADTPMPFSQKIFSLLGAIGFTGLTITDSLAMKAVTLHYPLETLYPACLAAGHDIILADYYTPDGQGHEYLKKGLADGIITEDMVNRKVERVLKMKEYLAHFQPPAFDVEEHRVFFESLAERSVTCVKSDGGAYRPLAGGEKTLFVVVCEAQATVQGELQAADGAGAELAAALEEHFPGADVELLPIFPSPNQAEALLYLSRNYERLVFIAEVEMKAYSGNLELTQPVLTLLSALRSKVHTVVVAGNPYAAAALANMRQVLVCYGSGAWPKAVAKVLAGAAPPQGVLPVPALRRAVVYGP